MPPLTPEEIERRLKKLEDDVEDLRTLIVPDTTDLQPQSIAENDRAHMERQAARK